MTKATNLAYHGLWIYTSIANHWRSIEPNVKHVQCHKDHEHYWLGVTPPQLEKESV